jgi:hypothetical protein
LIGGDKQKKMDEKNSQSSDYSSDDEMMEGDEFIESSEEGEEINEQSSEEGDEEMNEQSFEEDSASDDENFFEKQTKKKEKTKKIEFEQEETKEKFIKSLSSILSENKESILVTKKTKLAAMNQKLVDKQTKEFVKAIEDKKIFAKDHKLPDRTTLTKEAKFRAVATSGVVALFSAVQKSKKAEKRKEEVASGYTVLKNAMVDKKSKWNVLTDEIIEDDNFE